LTSADGFNLDPEPLDLITCITPSLSVFPVFTEDTINMDERSFIYGTRKF
jgi:hypothetical protein